MLGREQRAPVAADRGLRRESIHRLRTRDSRDRLHRERDHAASGKTLDALAVRERIEEAEQQLALVQARDLGLVGLAHLYERIGLPRRPECRAGLAVRIVEERRGFARARLDDHVKAGRDKLCDRFRHECHPALSRRCFARYPDPHRWQLYGLACARVVCVVLIKPDGSARPAT